MTMAPKDEIRVFVHELLAEKGERTNVGDQEPLISTGLFASIDVVAIVAFLEERFGVDFAVYPFHPDEFETIDEIHQIVSEWSSRPADR
jgi:acyl carrier protein